MREDARMETAKPRQSLTGVVVGADEERVWVGLLETSPYLTPRMREMITGSHGVLRFPAVPTDGQTETSPVPGSTSRRTKTRTRWRYLASGGSAAFTA
jgi:hypothetical protein